MDSQLNLENSASALKELYLLNHISDFISYL